MKIYVWRYRSEVSVLVDENLEPQYMYREYVQNMFRICTKYVQNKYRICTDYEQNNMYRICTEYVKNI